MTVNTEVIVRAIEGSLRGSLEEGIEVNKGQASSCCVGVIQCILLSYALPFGRIPYPLLLFFSFFFNHHFRFPA